MCGSCDGCGVGEIGERDARGGVGIVRIGSSERGAIACEQAEKLFWETCRMSRRNVSDEPPVGVWRHVPIEHEELLVHAHRELVLMLCFVVPQRVHSTSIQDAQLALHFCSIKSLKAFFEQRRNMINQKYYTRDISIY